MLKINSGVINRAKRVVIYAGEGVGKTTLASKFPDPLFIDTEGGTAHLDVRRVEPPESWVDLVKTVKEVAATPGVCKTLVIDTADWAEMLANRYTCESKSVKSLEDIPYGKGAVYLSETFQTLLKALDEVIAAGIHVVVTAHAKMRKFEQPDEMGAYDRWEMKLSKHCAPLLKEWADLLLFLNYKTFVVSSESHTNKVQGGKRVMYTSHHPCWDAKNRYDLPECMDLDYAGIAHLFGEPERVKTPQEQLRELMERDGVTEAEVRKAVSDKGHYDEIVKIELYPDTFVKGWLIAHWDKVRGMILTRREAEGKKED